jgi:hypothetical protein
MGYAPIPSSPGFSLQQQQAIIDALKGKLHFCPACHYNAQALQLVTDGIIYMPVTQSYSYPAASGKLYNLQTPPAYQGRGLPCIALICSNCGNLQFHSVIQLGLGSLLGLLPNQPVYGGL